MSDKEGSQYLMEIKGYPINVLDIWLGATLVGVDFNAREES